MVLVSRARVFRPSTSLSSGSSDCIMDIFSASDVSSTVIFFVQPVDLLQLDLPLLQLLLQPLVRGLRRIDLALFEAQVFPQGIHFGLRRQVVLPSEVVRDVL